MALTLRAADQIIRVCVKNHIKLFIIKQDRFNLPIKKLRGAVDTGRFGMFVLETVF